MLGFENFFSLFFFFFKDTRHRNAKTNGRFVRYWERDASTRTSVREMFYLCPRCNFCRARRVSLWISLRENVVADPTERETRDGWPVRWVFHDATGLFSRIAVIFPSRISVIGERNRFVRVCQPNPHGLSANRVQILFLGRVVWNFVIRSSNFTKRYYTLAGTYRLIIRSFVRRRRVIVACKFFYIIACFFEIIAYLVS